MVSYMIHVTHGCSLYYMIPMGVHYTVLPMGVHYTVLPMGVHYTVLLMGVHFTTWYHRLLDSLVV